MAQQITMSVQDLMDEVRAQIEEIEAEDAQHLVHDPQVELVDLRDPRELERNGAIPGAFHCPRGMLEFWIDPASPYHKPRFAQDKKFVFFCGGGWRSILAAAAAQKMGLKPVAHIIGGFKSWQEAGGAIEAYEPRSGTSNKKPGV